MLIDQIQVRLLDLEAERARSALEGGPDLDGEIAAARDAYVGAAVTEIATLRAELSGPQLG